MPNTTNFNWSTPADSDLVKDGAAAIRTLGSAIDTSLVDLKGGTTGQILSKATNADMDFTWITNDVGDITEVVASAPLTGGGASGSVTVGIQDGTTAQKGAVQLEDSTSSTSTTKASTPNSVKSAYDLANAAIPKSLVDAAGDLIYATANDTPARLPLGTAGQVLKVNSGATAPEWGAASGSSLVGAALTLSGNVSLNNAAGVIINWDTELFDTDGFHSGSDSKLTVPSGKGGKYLVGCMGKFAANATGYRNTSIRLNGSTYINGSSGANVGSSGSAQTINIFVREFSAGDYIEVDAYQNSGGSLNLETGNTNSTFYMIFLGA